MCWDEELENYNFLIQYIPGANNSIPDALSRRIDYLPSPQENSLHNFKAIISHDKFISSIAISLPSEMLFSQVIQDQLSYSYTDLSKDPSFSLVNGKIGYQGKYWVGSPQLCKEIIAQFHSSVGGGHNGIRKNIHRIHSVYGWKGICREVKYFLSQCHICLQCKVDNRRPLGLLQPLQVPVRPWSSISLDFITDLPPVKGYDALLVVVDRFSKFSFFIPCTKKTNAMTFGELLIKQVICVFGSPQ
jgi:hypothetical protein